MGNVRTNRCAQAVAIEERPGVLPANPVWLSLGPNTFTDYGAEVRTVARNPISPNNQREPGTIVGLTSKGGFDGDAVFDHLDAFLEGAVRRLFTGPPKLRPTAITATGYAVPAVGALPAGALVRARGFRHPANNGLKVVGPGSTPLEVKVAGLVAEPGIAPAQHATLEVCGVQGAPGELTIDANGDLGSTGFDLTSLPVVPGQFLHVGDEGVAFQFAPIADHGFARVLTIEPDRITLDKRGGAFVPDAGAGRTIRLFFGRFTKVCPVTDPHYVERTFQFEVQFPGLGPAGETFYEYAKGNAIDELTLVLPQTDKATMTASCVGTDTVPPSAAQAANANAPLRQTQTIAINTTSDIGRFRVASDAAGLTTYLKSVTLKIKNTATPNEAIGVLGC